MGTPATLEATVRPRWPYRLPLSGRGDGVLRVRGATLTRLLHVEEAPVVVHVWQPAADRVVFRAIDVGSLGGGEGAGMRPLERPRVPAAGCSAGPAPAPLSASERLELAIERMRFSVGVDDDYSEFYGDFKLDPLVGPAVRRKPWRRPRRRPWPWEALAWAVTEQLIQVSRANEIQRWIVRRWGPKLEPREAWTGPGPLRDVPCAAAIAGRAPAELAAMDLAPARALALVKCAREVAAGRADLFDPASDDRLVRIPEIGPWTLQCLGMFGRGDPDSLPAGDLAYVKLVGYLMRLGRRATVEEVEEYFAPYAPFRGLAGMFALSHWGAAMGAGPPAAVAA